ncbi:hypothetical protein [Hansschlegelia plantiphila]|nr:hypothetical protein [Hansschlegelia plantiphila]
MSERMMCPECGSCRVTVVFSPPGPGGASQAEPEPERATRDLEPNFVVEEWPGGQFGRMVAASSNLDIAYERLVSVLASCSN